MGPRPARRKRSATDAGRRNPGSGSASALTERLLPPRRLVHPLHRLRVLGLRTGALADNDRLEAALCQQFHQGLGLRAELGLSKGPVALLAAGRELDAGEVDVEPCRMRAQTKSA